MNACRVGVKVRGPLPIIGNFLGVEGSHKEKQGLRESTRFGGGAGGVGGVGGGGWGLGGGWGVPRRVIG